MYGYLRVSAIQIMDKASNEVQPTASGSFDQIVFTTSLDSAIIHLLEQSRFSDFCTG